MYPQPLIAGIDPAFLSPLAIFVSVTLVMWVILEKVSGEDRPRAEVRLDRMRKKQRTRNLSELAKDTTETKQTLANVCLLYTSPSPRDLSTSRMPSSA